MTRVRQQARKVYAAEFDRMGGANRKVADSIRSGLEGFWISPALDALERLVLLSGNAEDDPEDDSP